jgi:hypothetical protein
MSDNEFKEMKLLQLKLSECTIPVVKPTKGEKNRVRHMKKMKFYSLEEVKKKLKI